MYKLYEYCKNCGNGSFCVMVLYGCKLSVTCVSIVHVRKYVWDVYIYMCKNKKIIKKKKKTVQAAVSNSSPDCVLPWPYTTLIYSAGLT